MIERSALILEQTARHNPSFFLQQCTMGQLVKNCSKTIMLIHDESNSYASSNNIHVWTIFAKYKHTFLISFGWFGMEKPSLNVFKLKSVNQAGPKNVCPQIDQKYFWQQDGQKYFWSLDEEKGVFGQRRAKNIFGQRRTKISD